MFTDEFEFVISTKALLNVVFKSTKRKTVELDSDPLNITITLSPTRSALEFENSSNQSAYTGDDIRNSMINKNMIILNFFLSS